jgi:hypothetical protein
MDAPFGPGLSHQGSRQPLAARVNRAVMEPVARMDEIWAWNGYLLGAPVAGRAGPGLLVPDRGAVGGVHLTKNRPRSTGPGRLLHGADATPGP